jgi:hypothetical protein
MTTLYQQKLVMKVMITPMMGTTIQMNDRRKVSMVMMMMMEMNPLFGARGPNV